MSSDPAPADWTAFAPSTPAQPGIGTFILNVVVNESTSVTCVKLPSYDEANPMKGTKAARESILKLLTGKCDDICPLNFRSETERDRVTPDPYFACAPHWSTLSYGRSPHITRKPADIARLITEVSECVPFVHRPSSTS